ncbi:MAG: hypothetical protein R2824_29645 [Saprospiraceae bacterium]
MESFAVLLEDSALPVIGEEPCSDELALADLDGIDLDDEGFFLETLIYYNEKPVGITNETFPTIANNFPEFGIFEGVPSQQIVDDIGGVLLTGMAQINNSNGDFSFITGGNFSLVGNVEGSQIDPTLFARFVTTLWSVYYDSLSPGISIDPIAPNIKKHMVRYIGNVINTDLGRVMREADYTMKKWWIGTERPYIPGFRNSDELNADRGTIYVGVSKRNWFVPENMIFRQVGNMLLFKSGRMTLKTEFVNRDTRISADPADVKFAQFFTEHYDEIAKKHPIYQELLDYAKLVGLANYLKINRIPLLWFLMANKDLLLTEDSPGTVDELIRGSKYFKGIEISGGVEMTFQPGQYIYDQSAITAINQAINKHRPSHKTVSQMMLGKEVAISQSSNQNFSFQFENKEYSVIHQHSTSSGVDRRGIRYQTDIALKNGIEPGLELVRYYDPNQSERFGSFGKGWHLLKPYSIELVDKDTVHFGHYIIKKRIAVVNNLSGTRETLTFNDDRFVAAAYVPNSIEESQVLALLPMTDNSLILRDKIGNEFHFDRTWNMVNMFLGPHFQMGFEYTEGLLTQFEEKPYELEIVGNKYTDFLNIKVPTHLKLKNFLTGESELLTFKKRWGIAAYVPDEEKSIVRKMVLMTDGSFRLVDWENNEVVFFPDGTFNGLFPNQDAQRVVSAITQGIYRVEFGISLDERNRVRISNATLFKQGQSTPLLRMKYFYDEKGRLARIRRSDEVIAQN